MLSFNASRLLVGSSNKYISASFKKHLASPSLCFSPPEKLSPNSFIGLSSPPLSPSTYSRIDAFFSASLISSSDASGFAIRRLSRMLPS